MLSTTIKSATFILATTIAVQAVESGFILASTTCDPSTVGNGGFGNCIYGSVAVPSDEFNCPVLDYEGYLPLAQNGGKYFSVDNLSNNVCGATSLDAYLDCDDCTNYGVFVSGGDGTKIGFCYPVVGGGLESSICDMGNYKEFGYCELWDAPAPCTV